MQHNWGDIFVERGKKIKYFPLHSGQSDILNTKARYIAAIAGTGGGKCFAKHTLILMYDGTIKPVQDIKVGDLLMGNDSTPRRVLSLGHGISKLYKVSQNGKRVKNYVDPYKGEYIVNEDHILSLKRSGKTIEYANRQTQLRYSNHKGRVEDSDIFNISILDYLAESPRFRHFMKGYRTGVEYPERQVKIDPYFLGVWLGDGSSGCAAITTIDKEIIEVIHEEAEKRQLKVRQDKITYHLTSTNGNAKNATGQFTKGANPLLNDLREYHLVLNKHIPPEYLINSRTNRLQLLAGLIDTDGDYSHGFTFTNKNKRLACDVVSLARSLGFAANITPTRKKSQNGTWGLYYRVGINGDLPTIPTRIPHKKANPRQINKDPLVYGITITPMERGEYFGFEIDGNHLFLLADYTVVHNTSCGALWLMQEIQKTPMGKFLICVPTFKTWRQATKQAWETTIEGTDLECEFKTADYEYRLPTGGVVFIRSADNPISMQGVTAKAAWIDEGGQISSQAFKTIMQRLGYFKGRLLVTTTPYSHNFLYRELYSRWKEGDKNYFVRQFPSTMNPTYPVEEYERAKETLPPHEFSMLYEGQFMRPAGLVYPDLPKCIVEKPEHLPEGRLLGGIDWGWNDPFAGLAGVLDRDNVLWLFYERYMRYKTLDEHANQLPMSVSWYADSSRPDSIRELRRLGFYCRPCKKGAGSIAEGINLVHQRIRAGKLKILRGLCPNLVEEAEMYRYPDKDEQSYGDVPIDEHSHTMDALRYLISSIDRKRTAVV